MAGAAGPGLDFTAAPYIICPNTRLAMKKLTVIDLFCGAGGFSEGFRQQGFEIVQGVDSSKAAVETFNYNFGLQNEARNILDFEEDVNLINELPDTDVVIGSPPCISFSSSNNCGNADKTLGIRLTEVFLRIVAVKKHQPKSRLKAWFMENVVNSGKYIKDVYTFSDLNLKGWARKHGINPNKTALDLADNRHILNAADFGVAQVRKRLFTGEVVKTGSFPAFEATVEASEHVSVKKIFKNFPSPFRRQERIKDPNYPRVSVAQSNLTDYFYDTGIYRVSWEYAEFHKTNHPYMGKMFFPENLDKPSRTVTATKLDNSREALIYKSEVRRVGDGQYRTPTVREAAVLMSFPVTFQFLGMESAKWRLVGNAVCPLVSGAIAKSVLRSLKKPLLEYPFVKRHPRLKAVNNLNSPKRKIFDNPPVRQAGCRFRRHPFKEGNMTIALSNYCLKRNGLSDGKWRATVTYGTGRKFALQDVRQHEQRKIKRFIEKTFADGKDFTHAVHNGFSEKVAKGHELQDMYEKNCSNGKLNPIELIKETQKLVCRYANGELVDAGNIFKYKQEVHKRQLYALYVINQISQIANQGR